MNVYNEIRCLYESVYDNVKYFKENSSASARDIKRIEELTLELEYIRQGLNYRNPLLNEMPDDNYMIEKLKEIQIRLQKIRGDSDY